MWSRVVRLGWFVGTLGCTAVVSAWVLASGCGSLGPLQRLDASVPQTDSSAAMDADVPSAEGGAGLGAACSLCGYASAPIVVGLLAAPDFIETSGLAASRVHPGILYAHNDSGDTARIFRVNPKAELQSILSVSLGGPDPRDWEDIAVGPCASATVGAKQSCIFIGDIGDNAQSRSTVTVYRVPEPDLATSAVTADSIPLLYPDGPHNAETLMVDDDGVLYIVTKELNGTAQMFAFGVPGASGVMLTGKRVGTVTPPAGAGPDLITGGDYFGGECPRMALRSYRGVLLFEGAKGEGPKTLVRRPFRLLAAPIEKQGEALAFSADGLSIFSTSEGRGADDAGAPLSQYTCMP
jgi:hypothetical protein